MSNLVDILEDFSRKIGNISVVCAVHGDDLDAHDDIGQNLDEPELWTLVTHWINVGSYRRALSSTAVKMEVVPLLATAIDEPGAYSRDI